VINCGDLHTRACSDTSLCNLILEISFLIEGITKGGNGTVCVITVTLCNYHLA